MARKDNNNLNIYFVGGAHKTSQPTFLYTFSVVVAVGLVALVGVVIVVVVVVGSPSFGTWGTGSFRY